RRVQRLGDRRGHRPAVARRSSLHRQTAHGQEDVGHDHECADGHRRTAEEGLTMNYVMRHGRRIEVVSGNPIAASKRQPKRPFWAKWVKLPRHWISGLGRSRSANTYRLALLILLAAYEDKRGTGEVTLSAKLTGDMNPITRRRAAWELAEYGLITLKSRGRKA